MAKKASRIDRWQNACSRAQQALEELQEMQQEYQDWRDNLPENLESSAVAEKLDGICELDLEGSISALEDAEACDMPLGFGRD